MTIPTGIARCEGGMSESECAGCAAVAAGMAHRRSKRGERCTASQLRRRSWCVRASLLAPEGYGGPRRKAGTSEQGRSGWGGCEWKSRAKLRPGSRTIPRDRRLQWDMSRVHSTLLGGSLTGRTSGAEPNEDEDGRDGKDGASGGGGGAVRAVARWTSKPRSDRRALCELQYCDSPNYVCRGMGVQTILRSRRRSGSHEQRETLVRSFEF
jgi:hypothetical protein